MNNVEKLQEQLKALLDSATDKAQIEQIGAINQTIEAVKTDTTALQTENKEILNDYKDLIKHTGFKQKEDVEPRGQAEALTFEDALEKFMNKNGDE